MAKQTIKDKVLLERIIEYFISNDIPLSLLTERYDLSLRQVQLVLNKTRGFSRQTDKKAEIFGEYNVEDYADNLLFLPHEITEENPLDHERVIELFRRLEELGDLVNQKSDKDSIEKEIKALKEKIERYDKDTISKVESFIKELECLENKTEDNIVFVMHKYGITSNTISSLSALYNEFCEDSRKLNELESKLLSESVAFKKNKAYEREYQGIREELVRRNIKLVNWCIRTFFNNIPVAKDEIQMVGLEGLVSAINTFDYKLNYRFSTYAVPVIEHTIKRFFKELYGMEWCDFVAKESIKYYRGLMKISEERTDVPTPRELVEAGFTNLSESQVAKYDNMLDVIMPNSDVYAPIESDFDSTRKYEMPMTFEDYEELDAYEDLTSIPSYLDTDEQNEIMWRSIDLRNVLETLTPFEREVLIMRYGLNDGIQRTINEVSDCLNAPVAVVKKAGKQGLNKIKYSSSNLEKLKGYKIK